MPANYVTHLECSLTAERYPAGVIHGLSKSGKPLLVRYDLERMRREVDRDTVTRRPGGFWRYLEFLPLTSADSVLDLGEVTTPLIELSAPGSGMLLVKDEARLPTGSFKARGLGVAVAMAKELGIDHLAMPTNGNAGAALAAYAARAGLRATVFCPSDTPEVNVREIAMQGAGVYRVDGLIDDCGRIVAKGVAEVGWFDLSTLKEPYRIEGKKTMGLELAEQLGWQLPDAIFYPTGGGTGLIGMWKAFEELEALGWIGSARPKMFAVQADGCAPIVRAFEAGLDHAEPWEDAHTLAAGIRVPAAIGDFIILHAVRTSGGSALAVSDDDILAAQRHVSQTDGLLLCPEGAAAYAGWQLARERALVTDDARVVLFNCATGLKYPMHDTSQHFVEAQGYDRFTRQPKP